VLKIEGNFPRLRARAAHFVGHLPAGYVVISGFVQSSFVVTSDGVVVVDAPPALADKLPAAIKQVTDKPVTHFIYTHSHYDHVGSATHFPNAERIAHAETARILEVHADPERPLPTRTFDGDQMTLVVGGESFELIYPGPNHDTGNILVYAPRHRLAIMTDIVMPGWAPYRGWGNADYPPGILLAHDAILQVDFDTYVGGHVYRTGTRKDVEESREFFLDLWQGTAKAMGEVPFGDYAAKVEPGNAWGLPRPSGSTRSPIRSLPSLWRSGKIASAGWTPTRTIR
jgi:glyoxylase-like metal-dependent hydrolase (beta-lactamase superfamily II)